VWHDRRTREPAPPLDRDLDVDVAVIGAGITGVSTAWELARAGRDVVLLEATTAGAGTTGASTAKVSVLQGTAYSTIAEHGGPATAREYAQTQQMAVEHLVSVVERIGADCGLERRASWLYAEDADAAERLDREHAVLAGCGLPLTRGADPGLPFEVADTLRLDAQVLLDPVAYLDALVVDLAGLGGRVFEQTPVVDLEPGEPSRLVTRDGHTVRARHVVVATHFPAFQQGVQFARLRARRGHVLALSVPGATMRDMYVGVDAPTLRPHRDLWLVTGESFDTGSPSAQLRLDALVTWSEKALPGSQVHQTWAAQDYATPDGLPFIGALGSPGRVWGATGFGGWGIANGVLSGVLLRDLILDADDSRATTPSWRDLFTTRRAGALGERTPTDAHGSTVDEHSAAGDVVEDGDPRLLAPGEAGRMQVGAGTVAAYRDHDGVLHALSAACPHMGCLVDFDPPATQWQCPCHGSRFSVDGDLLEGPAVSGLRRVDELELD
jgi:glycine/D-amino acid oxidase-like deaminating enzyme/nitrite reductase/ring-hydroxylating ferredoxin subunit